MTTNIIKLLTVIWGSFLIPELFGMQIVTTIKNGNIVYAGWYNAPYIITCVLIIGLFVVKLATDYMEEINYE